jgi:hypothetical protein
MTDQGQQHPGTCLLVLDVEGSVRHGAPAVVAWCTATSLLAVGWPPSPGGSSARIAVIAPECPDLHVALEDPLQGKA